MLTFKQYWKQLITHAGKVMASGFQTWQTWFAVAGAFVFVAAIYATSTVNDLTQAAWALVKVMLTPRNVTVAIIFGGVAALLEGGRQLYNKREQQVGTIGQTKDTLAAEIENMKQERKSLQDSLSEAKDRGRKLQVELDTLQSIKEDIRSLVEFQIAGQAIQRKLEPGVRTSQDVVDFEHWKVQVQEYLHQHRPEYYTGFAAPVAFIGIDTDAQDESEVTRTAGKLLERVGSIVARIQGMENQVVPHASTHSHHLPSTPISPETPTMDNGGHLSN